MSELTDEEFVAWFEGLGSGESVFSTDSLDRMCALAGLSAEDAAAVYAGATRVVDTYQLSAGQIADLIAAARGV